MRDRKKKMVTEVTTVKTKRYGVVDPYVRQEEGQPQQVSGYVRGQQEKPKEKGGILSKLSGKKPQRPKTQKETEQENVQQFVQAHDEGDQ